MSVGPAARHEHAHAFSSFHGRTREGLVLHDRRGMLKAGFAGIATWRPPSIVTWACRWI